MKENIKNILECGLMIFIIFFTMFVFIISMQYTLQKADCSELDKEGYVVNFEFNFPAATCKVRVNNMDGFSSWEIASNVGNDFTLNNYGVKK